MFRKRFEPFLDADGGIGAGGSAAGGEGAENKGAGAGSGAELPADKTYTEKQLEDLKKQWEADKQKEIEAAKKSGMTEAERLAKLTEEEKKAERLSTLEEENKKYKEQEALSSLTKEAGKLLKEANLPEAFSGIVTGNDAESTKKNIESLKTAFDKEVQAAVEERLKGRTPGGSKGGTGKSGEADDVKEAFKKSLKGGF